MSRLLIRERRADAPGILIAFGDVMSRLPLEKVDGWLVKELSAAGTQPFGLQMPHFEALSQKLSNGVLLTPRELLELTAADVEIYDGEFIGVSFQRFTSSSRVIEDGKVVTLICFDSSHWECQSEDPEIIAAVERGFRNVSW